MLKCIGAASTFQFCVRLCVHHILFCINYLHSFNDLHYISQNTSESVDEIVIVFIK